MSPKIRIATIVLSFALVTFGAADISAAQDTGISPKTFMECIDQGSCRDQSPGKQRSQNNYKSRALQAYRVSCRKGAAIVDENGYNRVRTIECSGGTFTYAGRRNGGMFKVFLNSRTGRIVGRREI
jgi:hypothetical protein